MDLANAIQTEVSIMVIQKSSCEEHYVKSSQTKNNKTKGSPPLDARNSSYVCCKHCKSETTHKKYEQKVKAFSKRNSRKDFSSKSRINNKRNYSNIFLTNKMNSKEIKLPSNASWRSISKNQHVGKYCQQLSGNNIAPFTCLQSPLEQNFYLVKQKLSTVPIISKKTVDYSTSYESIHKYFQRNNNKTVTKTIRTTINVSETKPYRIFNKYGKPLTDKIGRPLSDIFGTYLVTYNYEGVPVCDSVGDVIYNAKGVSNLHPSVDLTIPPAESEYNFPLMDFNKEHILFLYDHKGHPLTDKSGKILMNAKGQYMIGKLTNEDISTLQKCRLKSIYGRPLIENCVRNVQILNCNGSPLTDFDGRPLYDEDVSPSLVCNINGMPICDINGREIFFRYGSRINFHPDYSDCQRSNDDEKLNDTLNTVKMSIDITLGEDVCNSFSKNTIDNNPSVNNFVNCRSDVSDEVNGTKVNILSVPEEQNESENKISDKDVSMETIILYDASKKSNYNYNSSDQTIQKLKPHNVCKIQQKTYFNLTKKQRVLFNKYGKPVLDMHGKPLYDSNGIPLTGENGMKINTKYRKKMKELLNYVPVLTDPCNEGKLAINLTHTYTMHYDKYGRPLYDKYGNTLYDKDGKPLTDAYNRPLIYSDGDTNCSSKYLTSSKTLKDIFGRPIHDMYGNSLFDNYGRPKYDIFTNPLYDTYGRPCTDAGGTVLKDFSGQPIVPYPNKPLYNNVVSLLPKDVHKILKIPSVYKLLRTTHNYFDAFGGPLFDSYGHPMYNSHGKPVYDKYGRPMYDRNGVPLCDKYGRPLSEDIRSHQEVVSVVDSLKFLKLSKEAYKWMALEKCKSSVSGINAALPEQIIKMKPRVSEEGQQSKPTEYVYSLTRITTFSDGRRAIEVLEAPISESTASNIHLLPWDTKPVFMAPVKKKK